MTEIQPGARVRESRHPDRTGTVTEMFANGGIARVRWDGPQRPATRRGSPAERRPAGPPVTDIATVRLTLIDRPNLTDREARIVAAWWQDPRWEGLAALACTGAIVADVADEIGANITDDLDSGQVIALTADERALESRFGITS